MAVTSPGDRKSLCGARHPAGRFRVARVPASRGRRGDCCQHRLPLHTVPRTWLAVSLHTASSRRPNGESLGLHSMNASFRVAHSGLLTGKREQLIPADLCNPDRCYQLWGGWSQPRLGCASAHAFPSGHPGSGPSETGMRWGVRCTVRWLRPGGPLRIERFATREHQTPLGSDSPLPSGVSAFRPRSGAIGVARHLSYSFGRTQSSNGA